MNEFPGNSHKADREKTEIVPEERVVEPVITGRVIRRKKTMGRRFMDAMFSGDKNSVFGYLLRDVLIPALQATATDMVTQGINRAVYGDGRPMNRTGRPTTTGMGRPHVSYDQRYTPRPPVTRPGTPAYRRMMDSSNMGDVVLEHRYDADDVMTRLAEILERYEVVTMADLNNLTRQSSVSTDHNWGWFSLEGATIRAVREGFLLVLPDPEPIQK